VTHITSISTSLTGRISLEAPIFTAATPRLSVSVRALTAQILETFGGMRVPGHLPPENAAHELVDVEEKRRYCLYCAKIPDTNHLRLWNTREEGDAGGAILNLPGGG